MKPEVLYFAAQAASIAAWWLLLMIYPSSRQWFFPSTALEPAAIALALPDLCLLIGGSAIVSRLAARSHPLTRSAAWIVVGATGYAALYTFAWAIVTPMPWLSPALMAVSAVGSVFYARTIV